MRRVGPVRTRKGGNRGGGRRPRVDWPKVRAEYEAGAKPGELAEKYKAAKRTIERRIQLQGWVRDSEERINALALAKAAAVLPDRDTKEARINQEADKRAAVLLRHEREAIAIGNQIVEAMRAHAAARQIANRTKRMLAKRDAFEDLKAAKISAEAMEIKQRMERKTHALDKEPGESDPGMFDPRNPPPFTWQIDRPGGEARRVVPETADE